MEDLWEYNNPELNINYEIDEDLEKITKWYGEQNKHIYY